jgi:hypothetical protein
VGGGLTRRTLLAAGAGALAAGALPRSRARAQAVPGGVWLPGELHCHSIYSHDVFGPGDDNTGLEEAYTTGLPASGKWQEAASRDLRFCAVTDHNDVRSVGDLEQAPAGFLAVPGYEASLQGHAQMLGARRLYDPGDEAADAINAMADALRADGGVFQANHPAYRMSADEAHACGAGGCADCQGMHWTYGFDVRPDVVEVWNPSVSRGEVSEHYWECWLDRGEMVGATGGSDSHWLALAAIAGPGQPTTWVLAREASVAGVLEGVRAGRTSISAQPPRLGGVRLDLEGVGTTVAPGTPLRITAPGLTTPAVVRVRANGEQVLEQQILPGGEVRLTAPADAGWVRALLLGLAPLPISTANDFGDATPQRDGRPLLALTSAVYVRRPTALLR